MKCISKNCAETEIPTFSIDSRGYAAASNAQKVLPYSPGIGCFEFNKILYVLDGDYFGIFAHLCNCNKKQKVCIKIAQKRETIRLLVSLKYTEIILEQLANNFSGLFSDFSKNIIDVVLLKELRPFCEL